MRTRYTQSLIAALHRSPPPGHVLARDFLAEKVFLTEQQERLLLQVLDGYENAVHRERRRSSGGIPRF